MSKPCPNCKSSLGTCSPDHGATDCAQQLQCAGCIFWNGTAAFGPGWFCELVETEPTGDCAWRLEGPKPEIKGAQP